MIVTIPVYPHVKALLLHKHENPDEPLKADFSSKLGLNIRAVLYSKSEKGRANERMTEEINVELNDWLGKMNHRVKKLIKINDYFDEDFKSAMVHYVEGQYEAGIPALTAVKNFLKKYGLTDKEYSYESAYRDWLRKKNQEYKKQKQRKSIEKIALLS